VAGPFNASSEVPQVSGGNNTMGFVLPTVPRRGFVFAMLVASPVRMVCGFSRAAFKRSSSSADNSSNVSSSMASGWSSGVVRVGFFGNYDYRNVNGWHPKF